MQEKKPPVIDVTKAQRNGDLFVVDGIEYAKNGKAAQLLGVKSGNLASYAAHGMPVAKEARGPHNLYPIQACREWLSANNTGGKYISKITLHGKLHYNGKTLAECVGVHQTTISAWGAKYGMPSIEWRGNRFYPLLDCLEWIEDYRRKTNEEKYKVRANFDPQLQRRSICNDCDNAYAHKCPWFRDYTPVEGWTATEIPTTDYQGHAVPSYNVQKCPNFVPDPPRKGNVLICAQNAQ